MKHWLLPLLVIAALLTLVAAGCGRIAKPGGWAAPLRSDSLLLVKTGRGELEGVDASSGQPRWAFPRDWEIVDKRARKLQGIYAQPIISDDLVFIADYNGYIYILRPSELQSAGAKPRAISVKTGGSIIGGIAYDKSSGMLFAASDDGKVYSFSASDVVRNGASDKSPSAQPAFKTGDRIWARPLLSGGNLYVASTDRKVYAYTASAGEQLWPPFRAGAALISEPVVSGGTLLVGGFDSVLYALDSRTGDTRWTFKASDWVWSRPVIDGSRVYVADFAGNVYALGLDNGEEVWNQRARVNEHVRSALALIGSTLVVGTTDGYLYGIDISAGDRRWGPVSVGAGIQGDLLADGGRVVVTTSKCVALEQPDTSKKRVIYYQVEASTGNLTPALGDEDC